jgi:protein-disulfide isomerase
MRAMQRPSSSGRALGGTLACLLGLSSAACGLGLSSRGDAVDVTPRDKGGAAATERRGDPGDLPGVDLSALSETRLRNEFWDVAQSLYAPCPDQAVPLPQCVKEDRACAACVPMTQLIADQIGRGTPKANAKAAALARFGLETVKSVPLRDSPARGPEKAPVTIVVFSDFQCPACQAAIPLLEEAQDAHPNEVRLVHKFYPLPKHTRAKDAAYAAYAAMKQGKYWQMEELLFENQDALSDQDLERYAAELKLDIERFRKDKASPEAKAMVERDMQDAEAVDLQYTPFILVNGRQFDSAYFRIDRDLESWIQTEIELAKAGAIARPAPSQAAPAKAQ